MKMHTGIFEVLLASAAGNDGPIKSIETVKDGAMVEMKFDAIAITRGEDTCADKITLDFLFKGDPIAKFDTFLGEGKRYVTPHPDGTIPMSITFDWF